MNNLYLAVNFFAVIVPFLFSFHPKIRFYKHWRAFFIADGIVTFAFVLWDTLFTHLGVWGFNPKYITGIYIFSLPLEEVLFFICIPYACTFTYHALTSFYNFQWRKKAENIFVLLFVILILSIGLFHYNRLYTSVTFISTAILLLLIQFVLKIDGLSKIFTSYAILLIPFFIVNGILTGTGIDEPVVWYNNAENLGLRLLTIPIEDVIYGFELIMLIILGHEQLKKSKNNYYLI